MIAALVDPVVRQTHRRSENVAPHELADERRRLQAGVHTELREDVLDVRRDGLRADP
jgi:hypothetical protein